VHTRLDFVFDLAFDFVGGLGSKPARSHLHVASYSGQGRNLVRRRGGVGRTLIARGGTAAVAAREVIPRANRATMQTTHIFELCYQPESRDAAVKCERDNPSTATMLMRWLGYFVVKRKDF
jgi:hypothetical protein